jgi:hypothetical protein
MPNTAFETMLASTVDYRGPKIFEQVINSYPVFAWIKDKNGIVPWEGGGENIETLIATGENDGFAARAPKTPIDFAEIDPIEIVEIPWRNINGPIFWYKYQEEINVGKNKIIDFVNTIVDRGAKGAIKAFASEVWQGGAGEHLHGLPAMLASTGTYMGKDRTDTEWRPRSGAAYTDTDSTVYGPYTTSEAFDETEGTDKGLSRIYWDCCDNGGGDAPDLGVTGLVIFEKLCAIAEAKKMLNRNDRMAQLGFPENIQYRNMTVVWDRKCGAVAATPDNTTFYLLNSRTLKLRPMAGYSGTFKSTDTESTLGGQGVDARVRLLKWMGNFVMTEPRRNGMMTGKT